MISYRPLFETMKKRGISTYTLRVKENISGTTVQRLKNNRYVSTYTLDLLCKILKCTLPEIAEFVDD